MVETTATATPPAHMTQDELVAELRRRFGDDPMAWAFICPSCKDIATAADFRAALADRPRKHRDGTAATASDFLGQECIGRSLGALEMAQEKWAGRGCDWVAYGFLPGPLGIELPDGRVVRSFHLAPEPGK